MRPISVHVPPGLRRTPVATARLAVSRLRRLGLAVRRPMADGGVRAVGADPGLWAAIERAAVAALAADPAVRDHVLGQPPRRAVR